MKMGLFLSFDSHLEGVLAKDPPQSYFENT